MIRFAAYGYPMPEQRLDGTWDVGEPDSVDTGDWGEFRIEIGAAWDVSVDPPVVSAPGTDITDIVDVRSVIDSLTFGEPLGPLTGALRLPRITVFDNPAWLRSGTTIDIWKVLPAAEAAIAGVDEVGYWNGFVASRQITDGVGIRDSVTLHLHGALFGEINLRSHQPALLDTTRDLGTWLAQALDPVTHSRPFTPFTQFRFESDTTGIDVRYRGSRGQKVADYVFELLGMAVEPSTAWTISQAYDGPYRQARKFYLREKSAELAGAVQQNTVFAGGFGVGLALADDITEHPNAIYGEGVDPDDGARWRNMKYPALFPVQPDYPDRLAGSTYPLTVDNPSGVRQRDEDFTAPVITQLQYALRSGGWPYATITGTFDIGTQLAIEALQEDAGVTVTGTIADDAAWDLVFGNDNLVSDLDSGYARPLSEVSESSKYLYYASGAVKGENDTGPTAYDGRIRVEQTISYGDVSLARARKHARRMARQSIEGPPLVGTVTLTSDPTDEDGNGRHRLDIREGGWLRVNGLDGGTYRDFYIAGTTITNEGDTVRLTVAEKPFDLLDLQQRIERIRTAAEDPAKSFYSLRTRPTRVFRDVAGWDKESGSGLVQPFSCAAGEWTVVKFIGAQAGTIESITARTTSDACTFALAVFGKEVDAGDLNTLIPDPLAEDTDQYGWWAHPDNIDTLESWYHIESWGAFGQAAGYSPGVQSRDGTDTTHPVTGRLTDRLGWPFYSGDAPYLWLAVFPTEACTFSAEMRIVIDEG